MGMPGVDVVLDWAVGGYFALVVLLLAWASLTSRGDWNGGVYDGGVLPCAGEPYPDEPRDADAVDRAIAEYLELPREERALVCVTADTAPTLPCVRPVRPVSKRVRFVPRSGLCVASGVCFDFAQLRPVTVRDGEYGRN